MNGAHSPEIMVAPGSAQHQVYGFLRHPHLRGAEAVSTHGAPAARDRHAGMSPDRTEGVLLLLSSSVGTLSEVLTRRPLQSAHLFHIALAVLSALHYLAQNGWRCASLDADDLAIDSVGRIRLDARDALRPAGFRQFDSSDLALVRSLLTHLAASCSERPDTHEADGELQQLFDMIELGVPLREAFLRSRCLSQARLLPVGRTVETAELRVRQSHRSKPGRRRRLQRAKTVRTAKRATGPVPKSAKQTQKDRARRRGAAGRLVGLATLLGRVQTLLGRCDAQLQLGVDWCERRARAVSEDLSAQPLLLRLLTPKAMATTVVAVAMLFALFAP
ncbi:hypothetical protein [Pseudoclavibacter sp. CFCC 13611]|uniref:hypothetical protein n=1 Tax=Pseudoclavibacter sp. CFCC 13611 TaxID=2615178 RepID=UPI001300F960|nr:hypothetical protein [Pseudoclavibacter sp. CFCC 13611]KAB1663552.1 hypothetical protein F8O08_07395 [Pseudoclavibacter sp. CFCC 13611]